ncbi:MAG: hypothetical protein AAF125_22685, partial [Chloroflexota bacterium]
WDGEVLALSFWWAADAAVDVPYTQLIHLTPADGSTDGAPLYTFDGPPFEGAFPTTLWFEGFSARHERTFTLPPDAPPGEYNVYTGLYHSETLERVAVTDADGEPLPNNQILLGMITVER